MSDEVDEKLKKLSDLRTLVLTSIVSALALVVGLFWNDAIKSAIEQLLPKGEGLFYKFVAAIIVTIVVVILIFILLRWYRFAEKKRVEWKARNWKKWEKSPADAQ